MMRAIRGSRAAGIVAALAVVTTSAACTPGGDSDRASSDGVPEAARVVMDQPQYANGRWQIRVEDLDSGEVLIDLDGDRLAEPGSFVKTYSTGAAWLEWGPDHTVTTPVKRIGEVADGTLQGDLVLVGKGDLTLGGRTRPDGTVDFTDLDHNDANPLPGSTLTTEDPLAGLDDLAAQVKASGIDAVSGDVLVDDRLFADSLAGQPISPIVVNQNLIDLVVRPGAVGEKATIEMPTQVAPWTVESQVETVAAGGKTDVGTPVSREPGRIVVRGTIAADSEPQLKVYAFDDPATYARTAFVEALLRAGVAVSSDPVATNSTATLPEPADVDALPSVAELRSLPLEQEATYVMKVSYNRGAQTLVCLLAVAAGADTLADGDCDAGLQRAAVLWRDAGLDTETVALTDGSGLEGNFVTARNAVDAQRILLERADADRWQGTLPVLGVDGSLAAVQAASPAAGKVFAKTGSLVALDAFNGRIRLASKALGGVMQTESGRRLLFAIIVNQGVYAEVAGVLQANDDVGAVAAAIQQAY